MNYEQNSIQKATQQVVYDEKRHLVNEKYNRKKQVYYQDTDDEKEIFILVQIQLIFRHVLSKI
ncbi:MAG: hypothetical protein SO369_01870 [Treponema sp.]|nr:hypothetical protein [Treponema sp.]MDY4673722.1 hypothetical protein [Treponema sp.]